MKCSATSPFTPHDLPNLASLNALLTLPTEILITECSLAESLRYDNTLSLSMALLTLLSRVE